MMLSSLPSKGQKIPPPIGHRWNRRYSRQNRRRRKGCSYFGYFSAGDGLCDETVVSWLLRSGDRIRDLLKAGVQFEKDGDEFHLSKRGHTARRILHAKDATGAEIERALTEAVSKSEKLP